MGPLEVDDDVAKVNVRTPRSAPVKALVTLLTLALLAACGELLTPSPGDGSGAREDPTGGTTTPSATWDVQAHFAPVIDLSWHPEQTFVAAFAQHEPLTVLHAESGERVEWRSASTWWPPGCAFSGGIAWSPAGDRVALPGVVLDTDTWTVAAALALDPGYTTDALAYSPNGALVAGGSRPTSGGQAGCVCLVVWDAATGEVVFEHDAPPALPESYRGYIVDVAWHPSGTRVAAASRGGTAVYDLVANDVTLRLPTAHAVAWSPDGAQLALALMGAWDWAPTTDGGAVAVVDGATGAVLAQETVHQGEALAVAWHPDGTRIVSGGSDATLAVLDATTLAERDRRGVDGPVSVLRFGPLGTRLAIGTRGGSIYTLPASASGSPTRASIGRGEVAAFALSPDGRFVASAGTDTTARVWRVDDGSRVMELPLAFAPRGIDWSPDGAYLALALHEPLLYDGRDGTLRGPPIDDEPLPWPDAIAFSPDGRWLAAATSAGVHLIDPVTRAVGWRFEPYLYDDGFWWVRHVAWSPDGRRMALVMHGGAVWTIAVEEAVDPVLARTVTVLGETTAIAWSGDGSMLVVTGSVDPAGERGTLVLDAATLEVVQEAWFATHGVNHATGFAAGDDWFWTSGWADGFDCPAGKSGDGNALKVWAVEDGQLVFGLDRVGTITDAAFVEGDTSVLIGTALGRLMRWAVPQ